MRCQLDTLIRRFPLGIRQALNELPVTLDETYERTLEGIPKEKQQHAYRLLQCLVAAIRPLRIEELAAIFTIEFDTGAASNLVEELRPKISGKAELFACSTLISVIDDRGSQIVQFSHSSVKEFLTSDRFRTLDIGSNFRHHIPLDDAHTILARACLKVLLQLDETTDTERLAKFPLAFYAARHWVDHAKFGDVAPRVQDVMERLFEPKKPYFGAWIWIHNFESWRSRNRTMDDLLPRPSPPDTTPLYCAAFCGLIGLTKYLIVTHGEDLNAKCGRHGSPLHASSGEGHLDITRLLLDHGADVNLTNERGRIPLQTAYDGKHLEVMRLLLERGADVNTQSGDRFGTLLHHASSKGQAEIVQLLLLHNANVNIKGFYKSTPLHLACQEERLIKVVRLLLEYGADVEAENEASRTPLEVATSFQRHNIVQVLLENDTRHGGTISTS